MAATKLYYYTTKDDYMCIYDFGYLWTFDGSHGEGVYLTDVHPECGGMEVVKNLYGAQHSEHPNTEVCLETSANKVEVNEISTNSGPGVWMSKSQLLFSNFEFGYFWSEKSAWKKVPLSSQIKLEHRILRETKSPVAQLKEYLDRQGLMSDFKFAQRNGGEFVCTATYRNKTAEATGRSKKSSKNEAAKCLIRQMFLENKNNYFQMWEQLGSRIVKERAHAFTVPTNKTTFFGECKTGNNLIKSMQDNIQLVQSSAFRIFKRCNSENIPEMKNSVLGSKVEDIAATGKIRHFDSRGEKSVSTCSKDDFVNKIPRKCLQESNMLRNQRDSALFKNLKETLQKQFENYSPVSVNKHVAPENVANIRSPIFKPETGDPVNSGKSHNLHKNEGGCGTTCNEIAGVNTNSKENSHELTASTYQTAHNRSYNFEDSKSSKTFIGNSQNIQFKPSSQSTTFKHYNSENTPEIKTSFIGPKMQGIVATEKIQNFDNRGQNSESPSNKNNFVNSIARKSLHESNVLTNQRASLQDRFANSPLLSVHEHVTENEAKNRCPVFGPETGGERSGYRQNSLNNAGYCRTTCNEGNDLNKIANVYSHESNISANPTAEIRICFPGENNCMNYVIGKLQDIRIENSSPASTHNPVTPEITIKIGTSFFEPVAENITRSENRNHSPENSVGKSGAPCNGNRDKLENKIVKEDSQALNNLIKPDTRFKKLLDVLKASRVVQSSPVPTNISTTSENTRTIDSSFSRSDIEDIADSDIGRKKIVTKVVSPAEETRTGLTADPVSRSSSPGSDTEVSVLQDAKGDEVVSNHVGNLQYLCAERGWQYPKYEDVPTGEADRGTFFIDCVLRGFCERGTGYSKKQAKQRAAMKMLKRVEHLEASDSQK